MREQAMMKKRRKKEELLRTEGEEGLVPPEETEGAYPEFTIPEGLDLSDIEPGEEKQVMATIGKTSEGMACIKSMDGVDLAGLSEGMYGPPPAAPLPPPPGPPMGVGMPPMGPGGPSAPVRTRARGAGLM